MNGERPTSRRRVAGTLLALLTLAVGACSGPHKIHRTYPADASSVNLQYEDDFGAPAPFVADSPAGSPGPAKGAGIVRPGSSASVERPPPRQQAALPPAKKRTTIDADIDPAEIVGLPREKVIERLGAPSFVRREASAEFWRYRADDCIVELYFYRRGEVRILDHLETRLHRSATPRSGTVSPRGCLAAVAAEKERR